MKLTKTYIVLICLGWLQINAQEVAIDSVPKKEPQRIVFSTVPNEKQKSLEPYYEELRKAQFGAQRFSIFEQLTEHYIKTGDTDSILQYGNLYEKEISNWDRPEDEKNYYYARAHYYMGVGNSFNGLLEKSSEWYIKGIQAAENTNLEEYEYLNKIGLANSNLLKLDADKCISILEEALTSFSLKFPEKTVKALIILGNAHLKKGAFEEAEKYYDDALKMAKNFQDLEMELTIYLKQGKLAEATKDFETAFDYYENTREKALKEGLTAIYFEGSLLLAKLYYAEGDYETANIALTFAYINAVDRENLQFQKDALAVQARCYRQLKDYQNAYAVMTQLFGVIGEINSKQQKAIIKELEIQYETLEKEKEITELEENEIVREAELERQKTIKNAFLIGFLVILIPIMALLYVYYQKIQAQSQLAKKQEEINQQKVTSLKQEQELNLIKASIEGQDEERKRIAQELHDSIGGNLAGIKLQLSSLTKGSEEFETINGQLDETYQLVRDISHTLIPNKFKENAFTELIREYVKSISSSGELEVGFHPHPEESLNQTAEKTQMELFKIIQELMTNTLKHANASKVDIHLSLIDNELSLLFEDNGKGFNTSKTSDGIGFENIKNRISELSGSLHIDSSENRGTVISIEIPNTKNSIA